MPSRRLTRLLLRVLTLVILSLVLALGALVVMENGELRRVWPPTPLRTALVVLGPVAAIWLTHFTLGVKSFGHRSLASELLAGLVPTLTYLGVTLSLIGDVGPGPACAWWDPFCQPRAGLPRPDWRVLALGLTGAGACLGLLWRREG
jgi:hypothetical protein